MTIPSWVPDLKAREHVGYGALATLLVLCGLYLGIVRAEDMPGALSRFPDAAIAFVIGCTALAVVVEVLQFFFLDRKLLKLVDRIGDFIEWQGAWPIYVIWAGGLLRGIGAIAVWYLAWLLWRRVITPTRDRQALSEPQVA
jgi:hypothetical protein